MPAIGPGGPEAGAAEAECTEEMVEAGAKVIESSSQFTDLWPCAESLAPLRTRLSR